LTEPTLLEMSGKATYRELESSHSYRWHQLNLKRGCRMQLGC